MSRMSEYSLSIKESVQITNFNFNFVNKLETKSRNEDDHEELISFKKKKLT